MVDGDDVDKREMEMRCETRMRMKGGMRDER